jgi:hypothetical protein
LVCKSEWSDGKVSVAMVMKARAALTLMLCTSLALGVGGVAVAALESSAFFAAGVTPRDRFNAFADREVVVGVSTASEMLVLNNCHEALGSIFAYTQPAARRHLVATNCLAIADAILARAPAHSFAWYVSALAAVELDDPEGFSFRLGRSQQTGPSEQWIAERRVDIAEDRLAALTPDVREGHDRDLVLLALSRRGVDSIARRYVRQPDFRDRITALVEQLDPEAQRRFLAYVQGAARRVTGGE